MIVSFALGAAFVKTRKTCTIERNPWDRLVSQYWFNPHGTQRPDFTQWLHGLRADKISQWDLYHDIDGGRLVDHVMRYHRGVQAELEGVLGRLGVRAGPVPHAKAGFGPTQARDHRTMYTDADAAYVAEACTREIEAFGYRFDGP